MKDVLPPKAQLRSISPSAQAWSACKNGGHSVRHVHGTFRTGKPTEPNNQTREPAAQHGRRFVVRRIGGEWDEKFDATEKWQVSARRVRTILASQTC